MTRLYLPLLLAMLLTSCGGSHQTGHVDPQKFKIALMDTVYARAVEPEVGAARLQELLREYTDLPSWEKRKNCLREGLLNALELSPAPKKNDIVPVFTGRTELGTYTVENVAFECVPGLWVTGNLYRPVHADGLCPGILLAHGHGKQEPLDLCPRFSEATQLLAGTLAGAGAVVFAWDMFAYGESVYHAGTKAHHTSLAQTVQTWSSLRAIDFMMSLKDVDPKRIAMTGASGGGTQTFLAAAIDERIAVSAPVVQVSSFFPGGCACESGRPLHIQCGTLSNNAEIAALTAPRPQLIVSDGKDWTRTVHEAEYPYIRTVYGFYGKSDDVANAHFPDEGHDYGYSKRCAVYRFFADRLGVKITPSPVDASIDESTSTVLPAEKLAVFPDKKLPEGALHSMEEIYAALCAGR